MKSVFTVAYRGTFGEFMGLYRVGDEKRVRWGKSYSLRRSATSTPAQRYPMREFLLDRECVLDAGTKDGTNPVPHSLRATRARHHRGCRPVSPPHRTRRPLGAPDAHGCIPLVHLISNQEYSDEELTPLYDLYFEAHDPGFDAQLTGSHDTVYDVARRWPHRQALADRIRHTPRHRPHHFDPGHMDMTPTFEDSARNFLSLLNKLPATPAITFRGFVDPSVTQARVVTSPALTATSRSIAIATNNLRAPLVAVIVGANGRDLAPLMAGAPTFNLEEVTYLPGTYFCQHPAVEFAGVTIQVFEEMCVSEDGTSLDIARPLGSWDPILAVLGTRPARGSRPVPRPTRGGLGPIHGPRRVRPARRPRGSRHSTTPKERS